MVISSDREVVRLKANEVFVPKFDGWFIPNATWIDINKYLASKVTQDK